MTMTIRLGFAGLLTAACGLAAPGTTLAATVGYHGVCSSGSSPVASITAAGHTPVAVATINAASLQGIDTLLTLSCSAPAPNADLNAAVANGMNVVIHDWNGNGARSLPGATVQMTYAPSDFMDLAASSPIATGPGGPLTNTSLDDGNSSYHSYALTTGLPGGSSVLTIAEGTPSRAVTFSYALGAGTVVYGGMPVDHYLPGGLYDQLALCTPTNICAGMRTYLTNLIAWVTGPAFTTCADEGYAGSKLTLCQRICEIPQSPTTLTSLIRLYTATYRETPPCGR